MARNHRSSSQVVVEESSDVLRQYFEVLATYLGGGRRWRWPPRSLDHRARCSGGCGGVRCSGRTLCGQSWDGGRGFGSFLANLVQLCLFFEVATPKETERY